MESSLTTAVDTKPVVEAPPAKARVIAMVATIPQRRVSCQRLLAELARQTRRPDGVLLVLDGYADAPAPVCPLPVVAERRTTMPVGAGARWLIAAEVLQPDDIVVNFDDDIVTLQAPRMVEALVSLIEKGESVTAAMGRLPNGKPAPPGTGRRGVLLYGAGCGLALRAKYLVGLRAFADEVVAAGGPDALGLLGDDDALVSAYLWRQKVRIMHAATGNIYPAPGTQATSQTRAKRLKNTEPDAQKKAIHRAVGWPWPLR